MTGPTTLYRYFDGDGSLLYVGITSTGVGRMLQHSQGEWWPRVVSTTYEHFDTRAEALIAERTAIESEHPIYNRMHNQEWRREQRRRRKIQDRWTQRQRERAARKHAESRPKLTDPVGAAKVAALLVESRTRRRIEKDGKRVVHINDLTPEMRQLVLALIDAAKESHTKEEQAA